MPCFGTEGAWAARFNRLISTVRLYRQHTPTKADFFQGYFKGNPLMLGPSKKQTVSGEMLLGRSRSLVLNVAEPGPVSGKVDGAGLLRDERHLRRGGFFRVFPAAMDFLVNGIFAVAGRPIYPPKCSSVPSASRSISQIRKASPGSTRAGHSPMWRRWFSARQAISAAPRATTRRLARCPRAVRISLRHPFYADVFPVGSAGYAHLPLNAGHAGIFCRPYLTELS